MNKKATMSTLTAHAERTSARMSKRKLRNKSKRDRKEDREFNRAVKVITEVVYRQFGMDVSVGRNDYWNSAYCPEFICFFNGIEFNGTLVEYGSSSKTRARNCIAELAPYTAGYQTRKPYELAELVAFVPDQAA